MLQTASTHIFKQLRFHFQMVEVCKQRGFTLNCPYFISSDRNFSSDPNAYKVLLLFVLSLFALKICFALYVCFEPNYYTHCRSFLRLRCQITPPLLKPGEPRRRNSAQWSFQLPLPIPKQCSLREAGLWPPSWTVAVILFNASTPR